MTHIRKPLIVIISLLILIAAEPASRYRQYAYAVAWHCRHGNYATFPGHRVRLPLFWWEEKDPLHWETYLLEPAVTSLYWVEPGGIEVSHVLPANQTRIANTDQEARDQLDQKISIFNASAKPRHPESVEIIRTKSITLYCGRLDLSQAQSLTVILTCEAPKFPYIIASSPIIREDETKSILSTFE